MERALDLSEWLGPAKERFFWFIGGGGKTASLHHLARSFAAKHHEVVLGTSTKVMVSEFSWCKPFLLDNPGDLKRVSQLARLLQEGEIPFVYRGIWQEKEKYLGHTPQELQTLQDRLDQLGHGQTIFLVEADGARNLPLKAPYEHEPVLGQRGLVVVLIGAEVLGRPLRETDVYGFDNVLKIFQEKPGFVFTTNHAARLILHPQGYAKRVGDPARLRVLINKADLKEQRHQALHLKEELLGLGIKAKVVSLREEKEYL